MFRGACRETLKPLYHPCPNTARRQSASVNRPKKKKKRLSLKKKDFSPVALFHDRPQRALELGVEVPQGVDVRVAVVAQDLDALCLSVVVGVGCLGGCLCLGGKRSGERDARARERRTPRAKEKKNKRRRREEKNALCSPSNVKRTGFASIGSQGYCAAMVARSSAHCSFRPANMSMKIFSTTSITSP